ncbi:IclR family transcriptional regulator [Jannaschia sp. R86511]|uniref:IclR family transcriptional regulator n=1 Tax=Jannaschia sp. R86511 TaxID=3093853 RepID=UPI0036D423CE
MPGSIQSIERGAAVLRLLAAGPRHLTLNEVAGALGLAKGTAHGILRTLVDVGFVEQDERTARYRVGPALTSLSDGTGTPLDRHALRSVTTNWADTLAARTGETVRVGMLTADGVEVVHHVFRPDGSPQTLQTGQVLPATRTALGRALLAFHPTAAARLAAATAEARGRSGADDPAADLRPVLTEVRRRGLATAVGTYRPGTAAVAAPVRGRGGLVVAAVGLSGPGDRVCDGRGAVRERYVRQVREVAATLTRQLQS